MNNVERRLGLKHVLIAILAIITSVIGYDQIPILIQTQETQQTYQPILLVMHSSMLLSHDSRDIDQSVLSLINSQNVGDEKRLRDTMCLKLYTKEKESLQEQKIEILNPVGEEKWEYH